MYLIHDLIQILIQSQILSYQILIHISCLMSNSLQCISFKFSFKQMSVFYLRRQELDLGIQISFQKSIQRFGLSMLKC